MATRLYLPSSGTPPAGFTPAFDAAWEDTSIGARLPCDTAKASTAMTTVSFTDADATDKDILFRQYISLALTAGQTITGNQEINSQMRVAETAAANNLFLVLGIRIVAADGSTVQKTVVVVVRGDTEAVTTLTNRSNAPSSELTNYTTVAGDRIVVEVGLGGDPLTGSTHSGDMRIGDADPTDLPADETTTTDNNPWVQLTDTLTFVAALPPGLGPVEGELIERRSSMSSVLARF